MGVEHERRNRTDEVVASLGSRAAAPVEAGRPVRGPLVARSSTALEVGATTDPAEREAEAVAERVAQLFDATPVTSAPAGPIGKIAAQRVRGRGADPAQDATEGVRRTSQSGVWSPDDTVFKRLRKAFLLSLREATVSDAVYQQHRTVVYDEQESTRTRLRHIKDTSDQLNLYDTGPRYIRFAKRPPVPRSPPSTRRSSWRLPVDRDRQRGLGSGHVRSGRQRLP